MLWWNQNGGNLANSIVFSKFNCLFPRDSASAAWFLWLQLARVLSPHPLLINVDPLRKIMRAIGPYNAIQNLFEVEICKWSYVNTNGRYWTISSKIRSLCVLIPTFDVAEFILELQHWAKAKLEVCKGHQACIHGGLLIGKVSVSVHSNHVRWDGPNIDAVHLQIFHQGNKMWAVFSFSGLLRKSQEGWSVKQNHSVNRHGVPWPACSGTTMIATPPCRLDFAYSVWWRADRACHHCWQRPSSFEKLLMCIIPKLRCGQKKLYCVQRKSQWVKTFKFAICKIKFAIRWLKFVMHKESCDVTIKFVWYAVSQCCCLQCKNFCFFFFFHKANSIGTTSLFPDQGKYSCTIRVSFRTTADW
jgi:hypothetical protein